MKTLFSSFCFGLCTALCMAQGFVDVAADLGISHVYDACGKASGVAFTDFNGDGLDDLLLPSCSGSPFRIFKNTGAGFVEYFHPSLMEAQHESKCILAVDYDNDGDRDILVVNAGAPNQLFRCNGANQYEDISTWAGLLDNTFDSYTASFGDLDKDGDLDLYIGNRAPVGELQSNALYLNNGDGSFEEISSSAGVQDAAGAALAVGFVDVDNDSWPDLYVANDKLTGNKLYRNNGDFTFDDLSVSSGTNYEMDAMSVSLVDADADGFLDIYVTNTPTGNAFFINNQDLTFDEVAEDWGLTVNKGTWGAIFWDLDNDGDQDLYVPAMGPSEDLANDCFTADGIEWTNANALFPPDSRPGMGAAMGDYNQDGLLDLVVSNMGAELYVFENQMDAGNWIEITPLGTLSGTEAVGSWIEVHAGGEVYRRYTTLGSNFSSQDSRGVHIGIGSNTTIDQVVVYFPLGQIETVVNPAINQTLSVVETGAIVCGPEHVQVQCTPLMPATWELFAPDDMEWTVLDAGGKTVAQGKEKAGTHTLDLSKHASGFYVLQIQSAGAMHGFRLLR